MMMERRKERVPLFELSSARLIRAVHSRRQLQEIMVDFWMNHFNVFAMKGPNRVLLTDFEEKVIRPRAMGKLEDLLLATAKSPAMLIYLDNWVSSAPRDKTRSLFRSLARQRGKRAGRGEVRDRVRQSPALARSKGLNENYARELLELHTVSVTAEYSQEDVIELAKSLTGWTLSGPLQGFRFRFEPLMHEEGKRRIMGEVFSSPGMGKGGRNPAISGPSSLHGPLSGEQTGPPFCQRRPAAWDWCRPPLTRLSVPKGTSANSSEPSFHPPPSFQPPTIGARSRNHWN